jgi:hypothetical protein
MFALALHLPTRPECPGHAVTRAPGGSRDRAWYRCGGGSAGNIPAGAISVLKDTVPGAEGHQPRRRDGWPAG